MGQETTSIIKALPEHQVQILCFSATYPESCRVLMETLVPNANKIQVNKEELTLEQIIQLSLQVEKDKKIPILQEIYKKCDIGQTIIFVNNKKHAERVVESLRAQGLVVAILTSDL